MTTQKPIVVTSTLCHLQPHLLEDPTQHEKPQYDTVFATALANATQRVMVLWLVVSVDRWLWEWSKRKAAGWLRRTWLEAASRVNSNWLQSRDQSVGKQWPAKTASQHGRWVEACQPNTGRSKTIWLKEDQNNHSIPMITIISQLFLKNLHVKLLIVNSMWRMISIFGCEIDGQSIYCTHNISGSVSFFRGVDY